MSVVALAVEESVDRFAAGDSARVRGLGCRFSAPVPPGVPFEIALQPDTTARVVRFTAKTPAGTAVKSGWIELADPAQARDEHTPHPGPHRRTRPPGRIPHPGPRPPPRHRPALQRPGTTYRELYEQAGRERDRLARLDLDPTTPVGVLADKSPAAVALVLACLLSHRPLLLPSPALADTLLADLSPRPAAPTSWPPAARRPASPPTPTPPPAPSRPPKRPARP